MGAGAASTSTRYVPGTKLGSLPELILRHNSFVRCSTHFAGKFS